MEEIKVMIPEAKIQQRIRDLAHQINHDYRGKEVVAICVLKGTFVFYADIIRHIDIPIHCEFLGLSSYGNETSSSGEVKVTLDITEPLAGKHVIVFEDIVDTGLTIHYILQMLKTRSPASVRVCSLLAKPECLKVPVETDYVGFNIENKFVVGYGVDASERLRGLPYIGYVEKKH
jgi:hypoxanthine phosphoribosyltransferase